MMSWPISALTVQNAPDPPVMELEVKVVEASYWERSRNFESVNSQPVTDVCSFRASMLPTRLTPLNLQRLKLRECEAVEVVARRTSSRLDEKSVKEESEKLTRLGRPRSAGTFHLRSLVPVWRMLLLTVSEIPYTEASMKSTLSVCTKQSEIERLPLREARGAAREANSQSRMERAEFTRKAVCAKEPANFKLLRMRWLLT
jgi:hypothetical protein